MAASRRIRDHTTNLCKSSKYVAEIIQQEIKQTIY